MHRNDLIPAGGVTVTPSDTTQLGLVGLYVGTTGNVTVVDKYGTTLAFANAPAGFILPMGIAKVKATGTTASDIIGFIP